MSQLKKNAALAAARSINKVIAGNSGISKNAVKSYPDPIIELNKPIEDILSLDDLVLQSIFNPGNPAYKDERYQDMKNIMKYYATALKGNGVKQKLLWEEYIAEAPNGCGLTRFTFQLLLQQVAWKTMV